jgi:hypothetical protein
MTISRPLGIAALFLLGYGASTAFPPFTDSPNSSNKITGVSAKVSDDYARGTLSNGSFQSETYAFGEGGYYPAGIYDPTIDNLTFNQVARTLAEPLADRNFQPTRDPGKTKLLIMVYWGETTGSLDNHWGGMSVSGRSTYDGGNIVLTTAQVAMSDARNAAILGYDSELSEFGWKARRERPDLLADIERGRYFVVLMAYDFQLMWRQNKHKLLWETRFSIRENGNEFDRMLPAMAKYASQYFGENTHGLVRRPLPEGSVDVGAPKSLGVESEKTDSPPDAVLVADANIFTARSADRAPATATLPAALAGHIASYQRERSALQDALATKIKAQAIGGHTQQAIDAFNAENSARIAALNRDAEGIRSELAGFAAQGRQPADGQSAENLVRQFNDSVKEIQETEPLLTHP